MMASSGLPRSSRAGIRGSDILHPTLLRGMANSIGANTYANTAITRNSNIITPTTMVGAPSMMGMTGVTGMTNMTGVIGEIQGTH
jgi:hypothetical protein